MGVQGVQINKIKYLAKISGGTGVSLYISISYRLSNRYRSVCTPCTPLKWGYNAVVKIIMKNLFTRLAGSLELTPCLGDLMIETSTLIDAWYRHFGTAPITAVHAVATTEIAPDLLSAMGNIDPEILDLRRPRLLSRALLSLEGHVLTDSSGAKWRFQRDSSGTRWRLRSSEVVAA